MAKQLTDTKLDIMSFSRAELDVLISRMTDKGIPVCVNVPEELIRRIPDYIRNRVRFVNCESEAMLCNEASDLVINTSMTDEWGQLSPRVSNATKAVMMESILNGGGTMTIDEVLEACDKHRESQEGVGLSDELIRIVTFAYEQGCGARAVGSLKDLI